MVYTDPNETYEAPTVTDLGRLEDLTRGTQIPGATMEQSSMKT
jgi:hypothetical protein